MGVLITGEFTGGVGSVMRHTPSGTTIVTDPPVDNGGSGSSFSPTDLLAASYGACMMAVMALQARREGWDLRGMKVSVEKNMTSKPPRRVAQLVINLSLPSHLDEGTRESLIATARSCPVAMSVSKEVDIVFAVNFV